jgi:hypothetical protein
MRFSVKTTSSGATDKEHQFVAVGDSDRNSDKNRSNSKTATEIATKQTKFDPVFVAISVAQRVLREKRYCRYYKMAENLGSFQNSCSGHSQTIATPPTHQEILSRPKRIDDKKLFHHKHMSEF